MTREPTAGGEVKDWELTAACGHTVLYHRPEVPEYQELKRQRVEGKPCPACRKTANVERERAEQEANRARRQARREREQARQAARERLVAERLKLDRIVIHPIERAHSPG